jgi:hypothetical protein
MIRFTCSCGTPLDAAQDPSGRTIPCPRCGREQTVPDGVTDRIPGAPARAAEVAPVQAPRPTAAGDKAVASLVIGLLSLVGGVVFTGLPAILLGVLALRDARRRDGRTEGKGLALAGIACGVLGVVLITPLGVYFGIMEMHEAESARNLKHMARSMHAYAKARADRRLPPAAICGMDGTPFLSWRVAVLPYTGDPADAALYAQFKLDEPWDGPNNGRLIPLMPKVYALPGDTEAPPGWTYYRVFAGNGTAFDPQKESLHLPLFFDPNFNDIVLIVEATDPVPWTKPDELPFDFSRPLPPLGRFPGGFHTAMGDGTVRFISGRTPEKDLKGQISNPGPLNSEW